MERGRKEGGKKEEGKKEEGRKLKCAQSAGSQRLNVSVKGTTIILVTIKGKA